MRHLLGLPKVAVGIKPVFQDPKWLLSSDICLLLARRLGQSPEVIAEDFLKKLPSSSQGQWQRIAGYLTFLFSNESHLVADYHSVCCPPQKINIVVPGRDRRHLAPSYLRLVSLALLEGLWAIRRQLPVEVMIAEESFTEQLRRGDIAGALDRVVLLSSCQQLTKEETTSYVLERLTLDPTSTYSLFLSPGEVDPNLFKKGAQILLFDELVSVTIPERSWMADVDALPTNFSYLSQIKDGAYSLLLHLASNSRGVDIEWGAPAFHERKNFCWLLRSLLLRFESLKSKYLRDRVTPTSAIENHFEGPDGFILRFLPLFFERAVSHGEVIPLISSATTACMCLSLALNRAEFRIGLEKGDLKAISHLSALEPLTMILNKLFFDVD